MSNGGGHDDNGFRRYVPDARVWVMLGLFALAWRLLWMISAKPDLLNSAPFMTIATLILGGSGIGAVVAFLFGGTKTGSEVMKTNADAIIAATPPPPPGSTTTTTTATLTPETPHDG